LFSLADAAEATQETILGSRGLFLNFVLLDNI